MALSLSMVLKHSAVVILTMQGEPAAKKKTTAMPAAAYTNVSIRPTKPNWQELSNTTL